MRSATQNADVVEDYRKKECSLGPLQEGLPGRTSMSTGLASSQSRISREGGGSLRTCQIPVGIMELTGHSALFRIKR